MQAPSGRVFEPRDIALLTLMNVYGFIRYCEEPFTLKSGVKSQVYVFGREDLTDHPDLLHYLGQRIAEEIWQHTSPHFDQGNPTPCLIGIPTAGTPLAQAGAMSAWYLKETFERDVFKYPLPTISFRVMREGQKSYGAHHSWINGQPTKSHIYWIVDNVATDGKSKLEAADKLVESGYPSRPPCLIVVDRGQGALQNLERNGFEDIHVLYHLLDVAYVYRTLRLWPREVVRSVEVEIKEHQLIWEAQTETVSQESGNKES